jgi:hypothetical protein
MLSGFFISCADTSTNVVQSVQANLYQDGACLGSALKLSSADKNFFKIFSDDTSFSYTFTDTLIVNFWAIADCSSKSNLFSLTYSIRNDTIFVVVVDTAKSNANCDCKYPIQAEFVNLPLNHYVFYGIIPGNEYFLPNYIEDIYRNGGN